MGAHRSVTAFDYFAKDRFLLQERSPHPKPLRTLSRKYEDQFSLAIGKLAAGRQPGTNLSAEKSLKPLREIRC